ncbi:hypothetical protein AK812_SmicGene28926 [Symbiodinium microadriaticum]|uniref:Uncharacterized protein n=1 Tax=Symbiodinium microadriaticum TaxID=2951 RepID=A0A1Q9D353_SYMMI|nr:hypothetical protein AK812_SmicGene28926 [Symbiodinium microadriaticum]
MSAMSAATTVVVLGNERVRRRARQSTAHATGQKRDPSDVFMQFQTMKFRTDILHERLEGGIEPSIIHCPAKTAIEVECSNPGRQIVILLFMVYTMEQLEGPAEERQGENHRLDGQESFLLAISTLAPPAETSAIHQHLEYSVTDLTGIYSFLETFESKNQARQCHKWLWDEVKPSGTKQGGGDTPKPKAESKTEEVAGKCGFGKLGEERSSKNEGVLPDAKEREHLASITECANLDTWTCGFRYKPINRIFRGWKMLKVSAKFDMRREVAHTRLAL